jgi:spectinomycin phosphotransferase
MYSRPADLPDPLVAGALAAAWDLAPVTLDYLAVGFGSYHWRAAGTGGARWFVTVDDLTNRLRGPGDSPECVYQRLRAALGTARAVADAGAPFVVAPLPTAAGEVVAPVGGRFAISLYPLLDGRSREWGESLPAAGCEAVLRLLAALHATPEDVRSGALAEEYLLPGRAELAGALANLGAPWDGGPYGKRARTLLDRHASAVERLLGHYDKLAARACEQPERRVLTHGEPHPGNLIETAAGWLLVDWDTAALALPERDLWLLDPGDGAVAGDYQRATGREVRPDMLAFYRLQWELTDIADFAARFATAHGDSEDDRTSWRALAGYLPATPARSEEISRVLRR